MTTCPNATAPVNIVNNPDAICDLKCEYGFKYPLQPSLKLVHMKDYLSLKSMVITFFERPKGTNLSYSFLSWPMFLFCF